MVVLLLGTADLARLMRTPAGPDLAWLLTGPDDPAVVDRSDPAEAGDLPLAAE